MSAIRTLATHTLAAQTPKPYVCVSQNTRIWSTFFLTDAQVKETKNEEIIVLKPAALGLTDAFITTLVETSEAEADLMARPIHLEREHGELAGLRATIEMYESVLKAAFDRWRLNPM